MDSLLPLCKSFLLVPSLTDLAAVLLDPPLLHRAPLTVTETSVVTEGGQPRLTQLSRHQLTVPPVQQIEGSIVSNTHISILSNTHTPILSNTHALKHPYFHALKHPHFHTLKHAYSHTETGSK